MFHNDKRPHQPADGRASDAREPVAALPFEHLERPHVRDALHSATGEHEVGAAWVLPPFDLGVKRHGAPFLRADW
jgi:hypothetical protein